MKVIFLDIDGVLCTRRAWSNRPDSWEHGQPGEFHPGIKKAFEDWLDEHPEVSIVLSSVWRLGRNPYEFPLGWAFRIGKESEKIVSRIVDVTPRLGKIRGEEIQAWIDRHGHELTHFAIIDDDSDMLPEQLPHFVQTKTRVGLTFKTLERVNEVLDLC